MLGGQAHACALSLMLSGRSGSIMIAPIIGKPLCEMAEPYSLRTRMQMQQICTVLPFLCMLPDAALC
jgi:hypothetical protein